MGSVSVNPPKTPVTKGSNGIAAATVPNVCKMPGPPAPFVPTPLPNIGKSGDSPQDYSTTVTIDGQPVAIRGATFGSMGDVASQGTGGGIVSSTTQGRTKFIAPGSLDVKIEGKNVQLLGDQMLNNCGAGGNPPNAATMAGVVQAPQRSGPGSGAEAKTWKFNARIVSVTFESSVNVTLEKVKIAGPHWTLAEKKTIKQDWSADAKKMRVQRKWFSQKPAAHALSAGNLKMKAEIEVTESENVGANGKVFASFDGNVFQTSCETSKKTHPVTLEVVTGKQLGSFIAPIDWSMTLDPPGVTVALGKTWVELYFILDEPAKMFPGKQVPAEVLRFVFKRIRVSRTEKPSEVCRKVTRYCHTRHGLKYDIEGGGSMYKSGPMRVPMFSLSKYLVKHEPLANCYDQAAAVQSLCGALGVKVGWIFMEPFGYISATKLLGRGWCNNPFWLDKSEPYIPYFDDKHRNDRRRTGFGRHAFNILDSKIADACAGPHRLTETKGRYIEHAIDHKTTLTAWPTGDESNAPEFPGVAGVE